MHACSRCTCERSVLKKISYKFSFPRLYEMGKRARSPSSGPEADCIPDVSAYSVPARTINADAMIGHCGKKTRTAPNNDNVTTDDTLSNDDDKDTRDNGKNYTDVPACLVPFIWWTNMKAKHNLCLQAEAIKEDHKLTWNLCPPCEDVQSHIDFALNTMLSVPKLREHDFKFGVSAQPGDRWTKFPDYRDLDAMVLVYTSEDSDATAEWEKNSIAKYRKDRRLQNRKPGGENAHCGYSPHFLYIVFGTRKQFETGRGLQHR